MHPFNQFDPCLQIAALLIFDNHLNNQNYAMLFASKVVEDNAAGITMIRIGIIGIVFIIVSLLIPTLNGITPFFVAALVLSVVVAAIVYKGDLSSYKMEKNIYVFEEEMQISGFVFPLNELTKLKFSMGSYSNMNALGLGESEEKKNEYGTENDVSFHYKSQDFKYQFYLKNEKHFHQFINMLEQLYLNKVRFEEKNFKGKTFLMRNVNEEQYRVLIRKYY